MRQSQLLLQNDLENVGYLVNGFMGDYPFLAELVYHLDGVGFKESDPPAAVLTFCFEYPHRPFAVLKDRLSKVLVEGFRLETVKCERHWKPHSFKQPPAANN